MPSSTPKQARVMSAISHGWRPTGAAANIPVKVAEDFHRADAGKKYGHTPGPDAGEKRRRIAAALAR